MVVRGVEGGRVQLVTHRLMPTTVRPCPGSEAQRGGCHWVRAQEFVHVRGMRLSALHHVVMVHGRHVWLQVALVPTGQVVQVSHAHVQAAENVARVLVVVCVRKGLKVSHTEAVLLINCSSTDLASACIRILPGSTSSAYLPSSCPNSYANEATEAGHSICHGESLVSHLAIPQPVS